MTLMIQNFYDSIIVPTTVWNATLKFLRYGIERNPVSFYDVNYSDASRTNVKIATY